MDELQLPPVPHDVTEEDLRKHRGCTAHGKPVQVVTLTRHALDKVAAYQEAGWDILLDAHLHDELDNARYFNILGQRESWAPDDERPRFNRREVTLSSIYRGVGTPLRTHGIRSADPRFLVVLSHATRWNDEFQTVIDHRAGVGPVPRKRERFGAVEWEVPATRDEPNAAIDGDDLTPLSLWLPDDNSTHSGNSTDSLASVRPAVLGVAAAMMAFSVWFAVVVSAGFGAVMITLAAFTAAAALPPSATASIRKHLPKSLREDHRNNSETLGAVRVTDAVDDAVADDVLMTARLLVATGDLPADYLRCWAGRCAVSCGPSPRTGPLTTVGQDFLELAAYIGRVADLASTVDPLGGNVGEIAIEDARSQLCELRDMVTARELSRSDIESLTASTDAAMQLTRELAAADERVREVRDRINRIPRPQPRTLER